MQNRPSGPYRRRMRYLAFLALLTLSACIGYARGDAEGNVEVVTNWGRLGGAPQDTATDTVGGTVESTAQNAAD